MPLTRDIVEAIQFEAIADDIPIDMSRMSSWTEEQVRTYFESGGMVAPEEPVAGVTSTLEGKIESHRRPEHETSVGDEQDASAEAKARGNAHMKAGEYEEAVDAYLEALAHSSHDAAVLYSNLSLAQLRAGDIVSAIASAETCASLRPNWHKAHYRLGDAKFESRDYAGAAAAFSAAAKLSPSDSEVHAAHQLALEAQAGGLWLKQLRPGYEIAIQPSTPFEQLTFGAAEQMQNLIYLVGDLLTRECVVVDACWDCGGIQRVARRHRMRIIGAIATHYHFDHTGGVPPPSLAPMVFGPLPVHKERRLPGLHEMVVDHGAKAYVHALEVGRIASQCQLDQSQLTPLQHGAELRVGEGVMLQVYHTPGHSSGSICICVRTPRAGLPAAAREPISVRTSSPRALITGDTLFPGSCGRLDLPDSSVHQMWESMVTLRSLDDSLKVYPGHAYSGLNTTIAHEKRTGMLRPFEREQWLMLFGG